SFAWDYETPWFQKSTNPILQKIVGNWTFSGAWIYESPEFATPQSGMDANLNGDTAGDRVVLNATGDRSKSTDITPLCNSSLPAGTSCSSNTAAANAALVGYLVNDPNAYYVRARPGVYTTSGRNILQMRPIDNFDISAGKTIPFREHYKMEFRVDM